MKKTSYNPIIPTPIAILITIFCSTLTVIIVWYYEIIPEISWKNPFFPKKPAKVVAVTTDKREYKQGETMQITVMNKLNKDVCFQTCLPYYFEKQNEKGGWEDYNLKKCLAKFVDECIHQNETKIFEQEIDSGTHLGINRITIPTHLNCENKELKSCEEHKTIYSNTFKIK